MDMEMETMGDVDFLETQERNLPKPGKVPEPLAVDDIRFIYSQIIRSLYKQVSIAKFKGQSNDAALSYIRTLVSTIKSFEAILRNDEIETLKHQGEALIQLKDFEILKLKREIEILKQARSEVKS